MIEKCQNIFIFQKHLNKSTWKINSYFSIITQILKEVATEPPMDLPVSKLIQPYRLAWRSSNKMVSSSFNRHRSGSQLDRFQVYHVHGLGLASGLGASCFRNSDCLHVSFHGTSVSLPF